MSRWLELGAGWGLKQRQRVPMVLLLAAELNLGMIVAVRRKAAGLPGINEDPGNGGWL